MKYFADMMVVLGYFIVILCAGYFISKKHRKVGAKEFLTGGHEMNWVQTGLTLIAMSVDTGLIAYAGVSFVWGFVIQWNAVHIWITAPFAAMFLVPIYWRTKIITTPELLEKGLTFQVESFFRFL